MEHLTDTQRRALILADNKIGENASWDDDLLGLELAELQEAGFDLGLTGFTAEEWDKLIAINLKPEDELVRGYAPSLVPVPCACGTDVVYAPDESVPLVVARHNATIAHQAWRASSSVRAGECTTASGKVLLAAMTPGQVRDLLGLLVGPGGPDGARAQLPGDLELRQVQVVAQCQHSPLPAGEPGQRTEHQVAGGGDGQMGLRDRLEGRLDLPDLCAARWQRSGWLQKRRICRFF